MLDALFKPKSVAVIGASTKELSIGNRVLKNLVDFGFKGPIYPINPKADEVRGIKAYKSILEAPDNIDVVHMVIPAKFVPQAVEDCGQKGVKNIIINSGGFSEIGPEGEAYEKDFLARAKKYGIRMFGPNCQGVINSVLVRSSLYNSNQATTISLILDSRTRFSFSSWPSADIFPDTTG